MRAHTALAAAREDGNLTCDPFRLQSRLLLRSVPRPHRLKAGLQTLARGRFGLDDAERDRLRHPEVVELAGDKAIGDYAKLCRICDKVLHTADLAGFRELPGCTGLIGAGSGVLRLRCRRLGTALDSPAARSPGILPPIPTDSPLPAATKGQRAAQAGPKPHSHWFGTTENSTTDDADGTDEMRIQSVKSTGLLLYAPSVFWGR